MEESEEKKELEIVCENQKITDKNQTILQRKGPNEKKSTIIIGIVAGVLISSVTATFIGAGIYERKSNSKTTTTALSWDTDRSGFFDENGKFIGAGASYKFTDKTDDADRKYIQITSIEAEDDAYSYVFPSYLNYSTEEETETLPIYAVGRELTHDENFTNNFDTIKKNVFGFPETNKGITGIYFQSLYKDIGEYSFYECVDLEKVEFRSFSSGKQTIGDFAFAECSKLKDILLSDNLTVIGEKAFENDTLLENISLPNGLTNIGPKAFNGTSLKDINYDGTKSEWDKINKAIDWSDGLTDCTVHFLSEGTEEKI